MITRRGFLKLIGGGAAAAVGATLITPATAGPLFIPSQNLDMGVPRAILTATEMPAPASTIGFYGVAPVSTSSVPMLLVHDEFSPPGWQQYGRQRVPAGTTLLVDRPTAERWVEHGVGTPGPGAPLELQEASVRLGMTRTPASQMTWTNTFINAEDIVLADDIPMQKPSLTRRDDAFDRMVNRALAKAKAKGATGPDWWNDDATT